MAELDAGALVQAPDVQDIFETDLEDGEINAFINAAHRVVADVLDGVGIAADTKVQIEKFLAAHFCALKDPRIASQNLGGDYSETVQGKTGMGLMSTYYGQTAIALDTSGALARASMALKAVTFTVHGTNDP